MSIDQLPVPSAALVELIGRIKSGQLPGPRARVVFQAMVDSGVDVAQAMRSLGIESVDESALVALCRQIVAANPKIAADVKNGKMQAIGALVGQAKKANPNVDPNRVREVCLELIQSMA